MIRPENRAIAALFVHIGSQNVMSRKTWPSCIGLLTLFFVGLPTLSVPGPQTAWRPAPPDAEQVADLERLSSWLTLASRPGIGYRAALPEDIRLAIRDRDSAFELLRAYNSREARQELLVDVPYGAEIFRAAREQKVDSLLLAAVVEAESNFVPHVISPVGAVGLTQLMPATARGFGLSDLKNPQGNLEVGARYLRWLLDRYDDDLERALAAYNAGPAAVDRYDGIPPYRETRRYVEKVLSIYFNHHRGLLATSTAGNALRFGGAGPVAMGG
jgi:soluble lytic murein transglycosylase-like protein